MWVFTLSNGISVIGTREQIAKWLNFFGDVYDDDVWDEFCSHFYYTEWIDEDEGPIIIALDPLVKRDNKEDDDDDLPF